VTATAAPQAVSINTGGCSRCDAGEVLACAVIGLILNVTGTAITGKAVYRDVGQPRR